MNSREMLRRRYAAAAVDLGLSDHANWVPHRVSVHAAVASRPAPTGAARIGTYVCSDMAVRSTSSVRPSAAACMSVTVDHRRRTCACRHA